MWIKAVVSFLFLLIFTSHGMGQSFSNDPEKFLKEVEKYFGSYNKDQAKEFIEEYEEFWLNEFPDDKRTQVVAAMNIIEDKNLRALPDAYAYLKGAFEMVRKDYPDKVFTAWHNKIGEFSKERNTRNLKDFVVLTGLIFGYESLYSSRTVNWKIRGHNIDFESDRNRTYVTFEGVDLIGTNYGDSVVIKNTTGNIEINTKTVEGGGGIIDWAKVGLSPDTTYAEINTYKFNVRSTNIRSDSVIMHTSYFDKPLIGELTDGTINTKNNYPYPQFNSYSGNLTINNILPDINYTGGFTIKGASFVGAGAQNKRSTLTFERGSLPFVKVSSELFTITEEQILAENAVMRMNIGEFDSIVHPGINVEYKIQQEELTLRRGKSGLSLAPFRDSYHQLDMYCDFIQWKKNNPQLSVSSRGGTKPISFFESTNYFSQKLYDQLQGMDQTHPLVAIFNYSYKYDLQEMEEGKLATVLGRTVQQAKPQLLQLASYGFLTYDTKKGIIKILPKLEKYIKNRAGKRDYDNIVFVSNMSEKSLPEYTPPNLNGIDDKKIRDSIIKASQEKYQEEMAQARDANLRRTQTDNATLDLENLDFIIRGTNNVMISERQNAIVFPADDQVVVKKDRDFLFNGYLNAGKAEIYLNEASFDYSKFRVNLMDVDFMRLRVNPIFDEDAEKQKRMTSLIENMRGYVLIDDTTNRAGIDTSIHDFPQVHSLKKSYVFYEYDAIYNRVYDTTDFFFELEPFMIDSLDDFDERSLSLEGELQSAGIFPTFKEAISIQPDYSFGFIRNAPENGFDFYGTGAKYENEIRLSNQGLQGSGTINFVTSTAVSNNFTFLPDSTVGIAQSYKNVGKKGDPEFPQAEGKDVYVTYAPKNNILKAQSIRTPISMFDEEARLNGKLFVRPDGIKGRGVMDFENAVISSNRFKYGNQTIDADTANFNLKAMDSDNIAFKTYNVNAHISFEERKGEFKTNGDETYVEFPDNQYICYMDKFNWYMDSEDIELEKEKQDISIETDLDLAGSNFFSIHPDQDSLNFMAPKARFSLKEKTIRCNEVKYIDVADARIFPDSMKLVIRKKAKMDPLENSEIVANYITKYHRIINASTEISAKNDYKSEGDYLYVDDEEKEFLIHMNKVYVDTALQTRATGEVKEDQEFRLSSHFDFYGDVKMLSTDEFLTFNGATQIIHDCSVFERNWMSFEAQINPKEIYIPVGEELVDLKKNAIAAGIAFNDDVQSDSLGLYPTFLSKKQDKENPMIITANGVLTYDKSSKEFKISNKEKLIERSRPGNYIALHTESCSMNGDGDIDFGLDYGPLELNPFGFVDYNMNNKQTTIRWAGPVNFFFNEKALEIVAEKINKVLDLDAIDFNLAPYYQSVQSYTDQKTADKVKSDITLGKFTKAPKELQSAFYFGDIKFTSKVRDSEFLLLSEKKIGVSNILGVPLLKQIPGRVIIQKNAAYNIFHIYLEPPGGMYYYFRIAYDGKKNIETQLFTNDNDVKAEIEAVKEDKRKEKNFEYRLGDQSVFFSQFKSMNQEE